MKLPVSKLRTIIESVILEHVGMHRTMVGEIVPAESWECYDDVCNRIDDATHARNQCSRGSASRTHYNGILKDLRTKKNRLHKTHGISLEKE